MAVKGYATLELVEAAGGVTLSERQRTEFRTLLAAAEGVIDRLTERSFVADGTSAAYVTRYFDGDGSACIVIDDLLTLNELTVDDIVVASADYYLRPLNETPKTLIELRYTSASNDTRNVDVEGIWGYSTTPPEAISLATALLIAQMYSVPPWLRSQSV
ncbi:MAG: hypothetical protein PVH68_06920, partial [Armatimonadota bacterium]